MDRAEMERVVRRTYSERLSNDVERVCALFWDDALLRVAGKSGPLDAAAASQVRPSARASIEALVANWHWLETRFFNLLIDGNRAAVHYAVRLRFTPTREILETEVFDILTIRDGKISEFVEFCDTALVAGLLNQAG